MKRRMKKKAATSIPLYKNPSAAATSRVKDLLARMTLEEKAAQMMGVAPAAGTKIGGWPDGFEQKIL